MRAFADLSLTTLHHSYASGRARPSDVVTALLALGYSDREAQLAMKQLPDGLSVSDAIRQALRSLSKT